MTFDQHYPSKRLRIRVDLMGKTLHEKMQHLNYQLFGVWLDLGWLGHAE
jgi:hypothetical protein